MALWSHENCHCNLSSTQFHVPCPPPKGYATFLEVTQFLWASNSFLGTWTRKPPKSVPIPTVYNPDSPFHPMCRYPKLLCARTTNCPGQQKSLRTHGWILGPNSAVHGHAPWGHVVSVSAPTLGKCALDVKLRDNVCRPRRGNLTVKIHLALCGFTSCPEAELGAADEPKVTNASETGSGFSTVSFALRYWQTPQSPGRKRFALDVLLLYKT